MLPDLDRELASAWIDVDHCLLHLRPDICGLLDLQQAWRRVVILAATRRVTIRRQVLEQRPGDLRPKDGILRGQSSGQREAEQRRGPAITRDAQPDRAVRRKVEAAKPGAALADKGTETSV